MLISSEVPSGAGNGPTFPNVLKEKNGKRKDSGNNTDTSNLENNTFSYITPATSSNQIKQNHDANLIKSTDKVGQDLTSEGKLASIKEEIAALQQKTEETPQVDKKQDLSQPRYRTGPK